MYEKMIERRPNVLDGAPVISGTRIPVYAIKEFLEVGYSIRAIQDEYPGLTWPQIEAAEAYSSPERTPEGGGENG